MSIPSLTTENITTLIQTSTNVLTKVAQEIMNDPKKRELLKNVAQTAATAYVARKQAALYTETQQKPIYVEVRREEVDLNGHKYSGSTLRKLLSGIIIAALAAALAINKDKVATFVKPYVDSMSLSRVMDLLSGIMIALMNALKKATGATRENLKKLFKSIKLDIN